ncbi:MAG: citrate synthase/methylcitrate synthase [Candidatus Caldarchaeum sp.]|uniref:Citrate synthase n=1 Tax=Caldiarchaeum subterraneum TaxID=311458 RepID=A0A7C5QED1_CALS0
MTNVAVHKGLDNIFIKHTALSNIEGDKGRLYYLGYPIEELAEYSTYEEVCFLLLNRRLPTKSELQDFARKLRKERNVPENVLKIIKELPRDAPMVSVLRASLDILSLYDGDAERNDVQAWMNVAVRIISKIATLVAAVYRLKKGLEPVDPNPSLSHSANFLYMSTGRLPTPLESKVMDVGFILHAEHELPASSTAALVVASTLSDLYSAISAGVSALKGPLHGGANERALEMLLEIGSPEKAEDYVDQQLSAGKKIMGFGHRVYKTFDPRAVIFKRYLELLSDAKKDYRFLHLANKLEEAVVRALGSKSVFPNIDLYSGPVFHLLGLEKEIFTPMFAAARSVGWIAHVLEYWEDNRLIRPRAVYVGPAPRRYVSLNERL